MPAQSPAIRTLRVLELIQARPGITAGGLAQRLEVSERAIRRHVSTLREAGFSIDSLPGLGGGYRLSRGIRAPLMFSQAELVALTMALSEVPNNVVDEPARSAVAKILATLPERVAGPAQAVLHSAIPVADDESVRPSSINVLGLVRAIEETRAVNIAYRKADHAESLWLPVRPWALLVRHQRWYLLGLNGNDEVRTYRVDRIQDVVLTHERFERPHDLTPEEAFEDHLRSSWNYDTQVDIHAPVEQVQRWIPFTMGELTALSPDSSRLTGRTNNCRAYLLDLARTPFSYTVLGGHELHDEAQHLLKSISLATPEEMR